MGLVFTKNGFNSEFYPLLADELDYLLANLGEKQTRTLEFEAQTAFVATATNTVEYRPLGFTNRDGLIRNNAQGFSDFRIGDTIGIIDADVPLNSGYTGEVIEILNNGLIRVFPDLPAPSPVTSTNAVITVTTEYEGISYLYNLIGNSEAISYNSKIDFQQQKLTFDAYGFASTAVETMQFNGTKAYQISSVTVERTTTNTNEFRIIHEFYIIPVILPGQWNSFIANNPPSFFAAQASLRMINRVQVSKDLQDPVRIQFGQEEPLLGNVGWRGENFNTGVKKYNTILVEYFDNIPNTLISEGFKLTTDEIRVEITIENTDNSPFSDGNTKFSLNFQIDIPNQSEIEPALNYTENYLFDRNGPLQTVGSAAIAGQNFGGTEQVFKEISATFISPTQIKVIGVISMSVENISRIESLSERRFLLYVLTQNDTLAVEQSDREFVLGDANDFFLDTDTPTMGAFDSVFIEHPFTDRADGITDIFPFVQDEVIRSTLFSVDEAEKLVPSNDIIITDINVSNVLKSVSGKSQIIEEFKKSIPLNIVNGVSDFNIQTPRNFTIPATEIRSEIELKRRTDLDTGTLKFYEISYSWRVRFADFKPLTNVTILQEFTNSFFDSNQPNNGINNDWLRLANDPDWGMFVKIEVRLKESISGNIQVFTDEQEYTIDNHLANPDWTLEVVNYFDANGSLLPAPLVLLNQVTRIKADFTYSGATPPSISDLEGVLYGGRLDIDDVFGQTSLSSVYNREAVSWFNSILGNGLLKISNPSGNLWRLEADYDNNKIPTDAPICTTARIYDKRLIPVIPPDAKLLEDGQPKLLEDGQFKLKD